MIDQSSTRKGLAAPTHQNPTPTSPVPRKDASPSRAVRYLSGPYLSVSNTAGRFVDGSFGTDPEVFRDLRSTLRLGRGPAVDLSESELVREPRVQTEPAREPWVQGEDRLSPNEFLAGRGDEDAPMPPREVQQDLALRKLKEPFIHPRDEPQIHERVPGEAIAKDRAAQQPFRERDFPEIPDEIIERDRPRIEMQEERVTTQIRDDVVMIAHPHGAAELGESSDAEDSERDDSGRAHPRDPRPDAAPSEPIHDGPGDRRLARAVRAYDRVHVGGPRAARPRGIRAIARPFAIARNAVRFHGKTSIGIWEVLQNRAGDRLEDRRDVAYSRKRVEGRVRSSYHRKRGRPET